MESVRFLEVVTDRRCGYVLEHDPHHEMRSGVAGTGRFPRKEWHCELTTVPEHRVVHVLRRCVGVSFRELVVPQRLLPERDGIEARHSTDIADDRVRRAQLVKQELP